MDNIKSQQKTELKILKYMLKTGITDSLTIQKKFKISYHTYCIVKACYENIKQSKQ